jgi:hypothetical protein
MKTLIVHPVDRSTDFLVPIQDAVEDKTVVRKNTCKKDILSMTADHDRFIGMGHGTPNGLMSVGQFPDSYFFVVDQEFVNLLKNKSHNVFIWCYAYEFAKKYSIPSLATNMFISEPNEAFYLGYRTVSEAQIQESNECFVKEISKFIALPLSELYECLMKSEYANLSQKNPVAAYNFERLHLINMN